jgi:hypothetical protein
MLGPMGAGLELEAPPPPQARVMVRAARERRARWMRGMEGITRNSRRNRLVEE